MFLIKNFSRLSKSYSSIKKCKPTLSFYSRFQSTVSETHTPQIIPNQEIIENDLDFSLYKHLVNTNDEEKKLKIILLEIDSGRHTGETIPDKIDGNIIKALLGEVNFIQRIRYLRYCFIKEKQKQNDKEKQKQKRLEREAFLIERETQEPHKHIKYGLNCNTIFFYIRKSSMSKFYSQKLLTSMQFGTPIVMDMGLHPHMIPRELQNTADQIQLIYAANRISKDPFNVIHCNCTKDNPLLPLIKKSFGNMDSDENLINVEERSYLDMFPKDKLVYLSPHAKDTMHKYDPNLVYIIGAMVDLVNRRPYTLAKAKQEGVKLLKLPLDNYLKWGTSAGKSLTLDQMMNIFIELKETNGDFVKAFRHVPQRKLETEEEKQARSLQKKLKFEERASRYRGKPEFSNYGDKKNRDTVMNKYNYED